MTLGAVATALGITLTRGSITAEGNLDFRGTLGGAKATRVGFRDVRLRFDLDADAAPDQVARLVELTERYCVGYQTLKCPPALTVTHG